MERARGLTKRPPAESSKEGGRALSCEFFFFFSEERANKEEGGKKTRPLLTLFSFFKSLFVLPSLLLLRISRFSPSPCRRSRSVCARGDATAVCRVAAELSEREREREIGMRVIPAIDRRDGALCVRLALCLSPTPLLSARAALSRPRSASRGLSPHAKRREK